MRNWRSLLLAAWLVLSVGLFAAGCDQRGPGKKITLDFWHVHTSDARKVPIQEAVQRFMDANPGITVNIQILENDPYEAKLKTVTGPDFPDIFHSRGGSWLKAWIDAGKVADITAAASAEKDKISEGAFNLNVFDGKTYGLPLFTSSTILYYNKTIFAQHHLDVPQTLSELEAVCEKLIQKNIVPFALGNQSMWPGAQHFALLSMRVGGADIFQKAIDGVVRFDDTSFIQAGNQVIDMVEKGYFPEGANAISYEAGGSRAMFYQGQCAMLVQTSGFLPVCEAESPDFYQNHLGVALYPAMDGGVGKNTDILGGEHALSVSADSEHIEMATRLVTFLATDAALQKAFVENGELTALKGVESTDERVNAAIAQLADATYMQNYLDQTLSPELAAVHKATTQGLFGQTITARAAAEEMQAAYVAAP